MRLSQLPELEASYSGLELQVRLAAFRQQAFQALAQKCATAPNAAPRPLREGSPRAEPGASLTRHASHIGTAPRLGRPRRLAIGAEAPT